MINLEEVLETNKMVTEQTLDVRTITIGISLLDCIDASLRGTCDKIYAKLVRIAKDLVKTGDEIGREFGVPTPINDRIVEIIKKEESGELTPGPDNIKYFEEFLK